MMSKKIDHYGKALQKLKEIKESEKAREDPNYEFNAKQKALVSKLQSERKAKFEKIHKQLDYNQKELEKRAPGGWQAKVFEERIKQLNDEKKSINERLEKTINAKQGEILDASEMTNNPILFGLPEPVSNGLYAVIGIAGILATLGLIFSGCSAVFSGGPNDTARQWQCEDKIKAEMHDRGSYQYISGTKTDTTVTIKFRGKNMFGAYVVNSQTCNN